MIKWINGNPPDSCWCLVTYETNDTPKRKKVKMLWFNHYNKNYWEENHPSHAAFEYNVTHWAEIPKPPKD